MKVTIGKNEFLDTDFLNPVREVLLGIVWCVNQAGSLSGSSKTKVSNSVVQIDSQWPPLVGRVSKLPDSRSFLICMWTEAFLYLA